MPIQAANVTIQTPSVRIHINERPAPQTARDRDQCNHEPGVYFVSLAGFSLAGLCIAGLRNVGPFAAITLCKVSDTCRRMAEVTPAAVRCLTDVALLSRKLLCGGAVSEGNGADPFKGCTSDERFCLLGEQIQLASEGTASTRAALGLGTALGLAFGIGCAAIAIATPMMRRANAQRQAQPPSLPSEGVEMTQLAVTVPTRHVSASPTAAVQERQAIASSYVNVRLIANPDGQIAVGLNVADSASRPLAA